MEDSISPSKNEDLTSDAPPLKFSDRILTTPKSIESSQRMSDGSDSGYSSLNITPDPDTNNQSPRLKTTIEQKRQFRRVKIDIFCIQPRPDVRRRYRDLRLFIDGPFYRHLFGDGTPPSPVSITLRYMGKDAASAKPVLFVMCQPELAKKANTFFKQAHIKEQCQPSSTVFNQPSFEFFVYNKAPHEIAGTDPSNVWLSALGCGVQDGNLGGTLVCTSVEGQYRHATVGGLVEVTGTWGTKVYAMTVEHFMRAPKVTEAHKSESLAVNEERVYDHSQGVLTLYFNQEIDHDIDVDDVDNAEDGDRGDLFANDVIVDTGENGQQMDHTSGSCDDREGLNIHFGLSKALQLFGRAADLRSIAKLDHTMAPTRFDWTLLEVSSTLQVPRQQYGVGLDKQRYQLHLPRYTEIHAGLDARVVVYAGVTGKQHGRLAGSTASYTIGSSDQLMETYVLNLDNNQTLAEGDCGSWVIDALTGEVYGHVVAGDALGSFYVVPLIAIFQEIKERLGNVVQINLSPMIDELSRSRGIRHSPSPGEFEPDSGYVSLRTSPQMSDYSSGFSGQSRSSLSQSPRITFEADHWQEHSPPSEDDSQFKSNQQPCRPSGIPEFPGKSSEPANDLGPVSSSRLDKGFWHRDRKTHTEKSTWTHVHKLLSNVRDHSSYFRRKSSRKVEVKEKEK